MGALPRLPDHGGVLSRLLGSGQGGDPGFREALCLSPLSRLRRDLIASAGELYLTPGAALAGSALSCACRRRIVAEVERLPSLLRRVVERLLDCREDGDEPTVIATEARENPSRPRPRLLAAGSQVASAP